MVLHVTVLPEYGQTGAKGRPILRRNRLQTMPSRSKLSSLKCIEGFSEHEDVGDLVCETCLEEITKSVL